MWSIICNFFISDIPKLEKLNQIIRLVSQVMHFNNFTEDEIVEIIYDNLEQVNPVRKAESKYFQDSCENKIKRIKRQVQWAVSFKGCKNKKQSMQYMELSAKYFNKNGRKVWDLESMKQPFVKQSISPTLNYTDFEWNSFNIPDWFDKLLQDRIKILLPIKQQNRYLEFAVKFAIACSNHAHSGFPFSRRHFQEFMAINFSTVSSGDASKIMEVCEEVDIIHCYRKGQRNVLFFDIGKNAADVLQIQQFYETSYQRIDNIKLRLLEKQVLEQVETFDTQLKRYLLS